MISLAKGIIHPYYSVAAAPAIGALVGIGGSALWERRSHRRGPPRAGAGPGGHRGVGVRPARPRPAVDAVAAHRRAGDRPGGCRAPRLRLPPAWSGRPGPRRRRDRRGVGGPAAYALDTVATAHSGAIPSAGPSSAAGPDGVPGGPGGGARRSGPGGVGGAPGGSRGPRAPEARNVRAPPIPRRRRRARSPAGPGQSGRSPERVVPPGGFGGPPGAGTAAGPDREPAPEAAGGSCPSALPVARS